MFKCDSSPSEYTIITFKDNDSNHYLLDLSSGYLTTTIRFANEEKVTLI